MIEKPLTLYHSTPYPEKIEIEGLKPRHAFTVTHAFYKNHADPATATKAVEHEGHFVFATDDPLMADLYAFKIFGRSAGFWRCHVMNEQDHEPLMIAVVANAEAYTRALAGRRPTRFTILRPERFLPVRMPEGQATGEWVSTEAVSPGNLLAERLSLDDLSGRAEFFEFTPDIFKEVRTAAFGSKGITARLLEKGFRFSPKEGLQLPLRNTRLLWEECLIVPANHKLGLPPVLSQEDFSIHSSRVFRTATKPGMR